jgi:hypothetical protein
MPPLEMHDFQILLIAVVLLATLSKVIIYAGMENEQTLLVPFFQVIFAVSEL